MSDLLSWARKGVEVVCIYAGDLTGSDGRMCNPSPDIHEGRRYVIRKVLPNYRGGPCIRLVGIHRGWIREGWRLHYDVPFFLARFRPLTKINLEALHSDLAHFKHHLTQPVVTTTRERSDA